MKHNNYPGEMPSKSDWIFAIAAVIILAALISYAFVSAGRAIVAGIGYAEAQRATAECEKWNDWELVYPKWDESTQTGYFITPWQKSQCDTYGIELRGHLVDYKSN